MAGSTGIAWTDGTVNFVIGCTRVGDGCEGCYAASFADRKWGIQYEPGGERRVTKSGFADPVKWHRMHMRGVTHMNAGRDRVPIWVFACSLSDFFDKEWPLEVRARAWKVIRECTTLRWQLVTKRIPNVASMLPDDWNGGLNYRHVGIIATMVNQDEYDRDKNRLASLYQLGVEWTGISIEPQIGSVTLDPALRVDWIISGGESKQYDHAARPYHLEWARSLIEQCRAMDVPYFQKQMGDNPHEYGGYTSRFKDGNAGGDISRWPGDLRVQEMPRVYNRESLDQPERCKATPDLFNGS